MTKVHGNKCLPQETIKVSNKQPNFTPQGTKKRTMHKVSRRKEITKIGAEINETETKKTIEKVNKAKSWFCEKDTQN